METRKKIKGKSSRKISTQEKIVPHMMKMIEAIVTLIEYSLWIWKLRKELLKAMKKKVK
jgi:hypothetical protein